jgi:hypothetical protein
MSYSNRGTHRVSGMGWLRTHLHPLHPMGEEITINRPVGGEIAHTRTLMGFLPVG